MLGVSLAAVPALASAPAPAGTPGAPTNATAWTATEAPLPANASANPIVEQYSLACPSASRCVDVGSYIDTSGSSQGLLLTRSGSSWTAAEAPVPANAGARPFAFVDALACPSASRCVAVGGYIDTSGSSQGLLLTRSGSSWRAAEAPVPANAGARPSAFVNAVACPSASVCVAVGSYIDTSGDRQGLLLTRSGSSWTAAEAPLPANNGGPNAQLIFLACPSVSKCVAVGYYTDTSGNGQVLLLTKSGSSWTAIEGPLPANADIAMGGTVDSLTCPSASKCVAVGYFVDTSGGPQGLLLTRSGSSWTATEAPLPANASASPGAELESVTCRSASRCVAAGGYTDTSGQGQVLILTRSGSSWTATDVPPPANGGNGLSPYPDSLACPSVSKCVAAGAYWDTSGLIRALLVTSSGSSWTATEAPLPANANPNPNPSQGSQLEFVICPSARKCVAAGNYTDTSGDFQGMLLTGPG